MSVTQRWVLVLASVAALMVALDALVVSTALNTIRLDLGASVEQLEWTVNAYNVSFAVLLMTGAVLGDRFGRKRMYVAGLALFTVASAACALAPGINWLIAARAAQGVGAALVMPLSLTLLSAAFPAQQRARAMGVFSGVTGLAVLGGPVVGGAVAQGLAWQWIFWINVPVGVLAIFFVLGRIPASAGTRSTVDVPGLVLLMVGVLGVVWGLVRADSVGWGSAEVVVSLVVGVLVAAAFIGWELRTPSPMLPMRLFRSSAFSAPNAAGFFLTASLFGAVYFLAQFLQAAQGYGPLSAGLRLLPWTATLFVVAPIAGSLVNRFGERLFTVGGLLLQAVGMGWISLIVSPHVSFTALVAPLVIAGCGVSMVFPAVQNAVVGAVPQDAIGKASGTYNMLRQLGGVFGIAALVAVFTATGGYASPQQFSAGVGPAIGVSAGLSFLGALAGLGISRRSPSTVVSSRQPTEAQIAKVGR